jgi:N-acetyl-gamma-glutamyl-phosphate reductase
MIKVGIIGATGYAGQQLVWILKNHPETEIVYLNSHNNTGIPFSEVYGNHFGFVDDLTVDMKEAEERLSELHVLFIALPHGKSFDLVQSALKKGVKVIDLGADYRLKSKDVYNKWYGVEHTCEYLLKDAVYGLVELNREDIKKADLLANPGCYTTASILAATPLLKHGLIKPDSLIIDAKSGVSGAGRSANISNLYCEVNESVKAYGVASHRHTPEIEQELSKAAGEEITLTFTPHLIPMNRGILATCYGKLTKEISEEELYNIYCEFYKNEYFIKITKTLPETRWVRGSNMCHIGVRVDKRTGRVIVISAIDNLMKGAASQAVQNMNLMFGLEETMGLKILGMTP